MGSVMESRRRWTWLSHFPDWTFSDSFIENSGPGGALNLVSNVCLDVFSSRYNKSDSRINLISKRGLRAVEVCTRFDSKTKLLLTRATTA